MGKLFKADRVWQDVVAKRPVELQLFQVQVPQPYPGVQYRRSKHLDDKYLRYAKNGITVAGQLEDNGKWLRLSGDVFLPKQIGTIQILQPLQRESNGGQGLHRNKTDSRNSRYRCWTCCPATDTDVVVDQALLLNRPDDLVTTESVVNELRS